MWVVFLRRRTGQNWSAGTRALAARSGWAPQGRVPVESTPRDRPLRRGGHKVAASPFETPNSQKASHNSFEPTRQCFSGSGGFETHEQMRVKYQRAAAHHRVGRVRRKANTATEFSRRRQARAALDVMEDVVGPTGPPGGAPWFALSERNFPAQLLVQRVRGRRF